MTAIWDVTLQPDLDLSLGTGRGSTFSTTTSDDIPAPTLRGAFAAVWWRRNPSGDQADFDAMLRGLSFSNARFATLDPLDLQVCKYHETPDCTCGADKVGAKGRSRLADDLRVVQTRVELNPDESAADEKLFEREALVPQRSAQFYVAGDQAALEALGVTPDAVIRVGRAKSVSGRCTVAAVKPYEPVTVTARRLRVEMRTPGVFVDKWGFAAPQPDADDIHRAFGVGGSVQDRRIRWTTVGGWHSKSNRPKPEDPAVIAGSVYTIELDDSACVPDLVPGLGLRGAEGYGWASVRRATDE